MCVCVSVLVCESESGALLVVVVIRRFLRVRLCVCVCDVVDVVVSVVCDVRRLGGDLGIHQPIFLSSSYRRYSRDLA